MGRQKNKTLILFSLCTLLVFIAFNMTVPVLSVAAASRGASETLMGVITGGFAAISLLTRPLTGSISDIWNRRALYLLSMGMALLAYLGYASAGSAWTILVFRYLHGLGMGLLAPVSGALYAGSVGAEERAKAMGVFALMQTLASGLGPSAGIYLLSVFGSGACFAAAAVLTAAASLLFIFCRFPKETGAAKGKLAGRARKSCFICRSCILPMLLAVLLLAVYAGFNGFVTQIAEETGMTNLTVFYIVYTAAVIVGQHRIAKEDHPGPRIALSAALFACGIALCTTAHRAGGVLCGAVLFGLGYGSCFSLILMAGSRLAPASEQGLATGTVYIGVDLGYVIGPIAAGILAQGFGFSGASRLLLLFLLLLAAAALSGRKILDGGSGAEAAK